MFTPLPTPEEMARWDRESIASFGIREEMLMENASREALAVLTEEFGDVAGHAVLLLAGPGNNGGDAFALARHLHDQGAETYVLHTRARKDYKGAAGYHMNLARNVGVPMRKLPKRGWQDIMAEAAMDMMPDIVVDGLLGTGFQGPLREDFLALVRAVNLLGSEAFVLALDIPSGLDGLTGLPGPEAVLADATVTFEAAKIGLLQPQAAPWTGALHARRIGIPRAVAEAHPPVCSVIAPAILDTLPNPADDHGPAHKGQSGHVLVIGGSTGLTGAPTLAALGALRSGAGLVTVAAPGALCGEIKAGMPDIMTMPLGTTDCNHWTPDLAREIPASLDRFSAVVLGPGLGRDAGAGAFLRAFLSAERVRRSPFVPLVLDADGLYWLSRDESLYAGLTPADICTPHPGEMARLAGTDTASVQAARLDTVQAFARERNVATVLKGPHTLVGSPCLPGCGCHLAGDVALCPIDAPNLAVAGSGDVLAGCIGSLLGRGLKARLAACLGVYWHAHAGLTLQTNFPHRGNTASEIAHCLPQTMKELLHADG